MAAIEFKVVISDRSFNVLEELSNEIESLTFDYARIGGCGGFSFTLPRKYCDEKYISGDFNIKIYIRNSSTKAFDLWYQGLVEEKVPNADPIKETVEVVGQGYIVQLKSVQFSATYASTELSAIMKDILDDNIVGVKDITYTAGDVENTGFTANSLKFNGNVSDAAKTIADIAGTREWGVDMNRKFFMKARSSSPGFYFVLGKNIIKFKEDQSFREIVNRVKIQGGDVAGVPYTNTYNDTSSQLKFGRRDFVVQNSSITTDAVASQYATSIFADKSDVIRKATCQVVGRVERIEATIPIPLFVLKSAPAVTYGTQKYGTFLYSGTINRQINRISYKIDTRRELTISLDLGFYLPSQAEQLAQLDYKLEQLRSAAL